MSSNVNTRLFERAASMIDFWTGTPRARILEADIERHDLEALHAHVYEAESEASRQEVYGYDVY